MPAKYSHNTLTLFFIFVLFGFVLLSGCSSRTTQTFDAQKFPPVSASSGAVNINTADANELQKIPGIGSVLANKIIQQRNRYGPFRRPEEILIIDGISEKTFRKSRSFILIE